MTEPTDNAPECPAAPRRRWRQFTLRALLALVTLIAAPLAWLAMKFREADAQRKAVAAWTALHREVERL